jgi:oligopeptidase A
MRAAYNAVQAPVSELWSSVTLSAGVWATLKRFAATPEALALEGTEKRFLEKTLDDLRRNGADLDPSGKARLSAIDVELTTLAAKFAQNVLDSTTAFELYIDDRAALAGLPESAIDAARQSAASRDESNDARGQSSESSEKKERYRFTLQSPSYVAVMTYLDDASVREKMYRAFNTRATTGALDNRPVLARIVELRREKAKLLGFASFADLVLADRMAKTGERARAFVAELHDKTMPFFSRENAELTAFRGDSVPMDPWDVTYWSEKQRVARYAFDEEELRPYFAVDAVLSGLIEVARRLYGIRIEERAQSEAPSWHPLVRAYAMKDEHGVLLANFYVDLFPRETKVDGAWMHGIVNGARGEPHVALMCANVTPPVADRPALLTHREVETLFHEFGHLLHHCLSKVEIKSLAGTHVPTDFVELPSRIMENWCWEREGLDTFARHFQTGAKIPDALFDKMRRARTYRAANAMMRQLGFAAVDLALHSGDEPTQGSDATRVARRVFERYSPAPLPSDYAMIASFSHLFADAVGYAAGYYSYEWAAVLDADAFTRFRNEGLFNADVGRAFRETILEKGDSEDVGELYRRFMGREPSLDALLERSGFVARA